jgi:hypothetical protein
MQERFACKLTGVEDWTSSAMSISTLMFVLPPGQFAFDVGRFDLFDQSEAAASSAS